MIFHNIAFFFIFDQINAALMNRRNVLYMYIIMVSLGRFLPFLIIHQLIWGFIYIYIYVYVCVYVCMKSWNRQTAQNKKTYNILHI